MKNKPLLLTVLALSLSLADASAITFTTNTTIGPGNLGYEGEPIIVQNCTLTVGGAHTFQSLHITGSGRVTTDPAYALADRRVNLTIVADAQVDTEAAISVSTAGYEPASGPGAAVACGGSHGGEGGVYPSFVAGAAYGSPFAPTDLGSGGGNGYNASGGCGGGALQLNVGGTLTVNGALLADGGDGAINFQGNAAWGGSGGSIHVMTGTLAGGGVISAKGGSSSIGGAAGGGGGRIAIYQTTTTFSGTVSAQGGTSLESRSGGAGTIFTQTVGQPGEMVVDNANVVRGSHTPLSSPTPFNLTISNGAMVYPTAALNLGNVTVKSSGLLTTLPGQPALNLTATGNVLIEATGRVNVTGSGHAAASGPGAGSPGNGGGHGGEGGRAPSLEVSSGAYDSLLTPSEFGSGGGNAYASLGGEGGGAIRLSVGQTLQVDGEIVANGANAVMGASGGGGAGGALHLTAGAFTGSGVVAANGGSSVGLGYGYGGGGGGGRIAIYSATRTFSGTISAFPGTGQLQPGGAGTVYLQLNSQAVGDLLVDSGGTAGAFTPLSSSVACRVTLANRARAYPLAALTLNSLHLKTDTLLTHLDSQTGLNLTVEGDLVADAGSAINVNGKGYAAATGPGAGANGGGGGHGGAGGNVDGGGVGGSTNDSPTAPILPGSGGANVSNGGTGGGVIRLIVGGRLELSGELSADGLAGVGSYGGGGAGGSIWVTANTLVGAGPISTRGGNSVWGGGGGGGRIALFADDRNAYTGHTSATNGQGNFPGSPGQPGTVIPLPVSVWRNSQFSPAELGNNLLEATVWGDNADPDGDGLSNALEFALGTQAKTSDGAARRPHSSVVSGVLSFSYRRPIGGVSGVTYGVQFRTSDLASGGTGWSAASTPADYTQNLISYGDGTETVTITLTAPVGVRTFARLFVTY